MNIESVQSILAIDCGSTTTKAILIEKREGEFRLIVRGEAPTTVEAPVEDVMRGVFNSIIEVEELAGKRILSEDGKTIIKPSQGEKGVDLFVATSSAGGGLQMMVAGVVKTMSGESAARAALGAGAIVMDVLAINDGRLSHQKIGHIRHLRPDMILLSGGVEGGNISHVAEIAEIIAAANPKARLGKEFTLPLLYAGNIEAQTLVKERLSEKVTLDITDNLRPTMEMENLDPARRKIQKLFLEHVMSQAPGYSKLIELTDAPILPTPGAVGEIVQAVSRKKCLNVLGADIGGATTDIFSVFQGKYHKSVSANFGMSYSISNVLSEAGFDNIVRWIPFEIEERELQNRIKNKMIRPTAIPATLEDLMIEHACAREALKLSFSQHKTLAVELKGIHQKRSIGDVFEQTTSGRSLINLLDLQLLIGSGGVLSHAPRRQQAAMILMDAFLPEGITTLAVDSIFMMPQLGALGRVHETAALSVFERDCLINLGTCIAPIGQDKPGQLALEAAIDFPNKKKEVLHLKFGEMIVVPLPTGKKARALMKPLTKLDLGEGEGQSVTIELQGGAVGIIFDLRGRPLSNFPDRKQHMKRLETWNCALNMYPGF